MSAADFYCGILHTLNDQTDELSKKRCTVIQRKLGALLGLQGPPSEKPQAAFVMTHLGMGDMINCIGLVRYISTCYDTTTVVCKASALENMRQIYAEDPTINFHVVESDKDISPAFRGDYDEFFAALGDREPILCGDHAIIWADRMQSQAPLPFNFYEDANVSQDYFWDYARIPSTAASKALAATVAHISYIVTHMGSSTGAVFDVKTLESAGYSAESVCILDINTNIYTPGHRWHALAETFVNRPMLDYVDAICGAHAVILSDSSVFCIALQLPIKTGECYVVSRSGADYSYLYGPDCGYLPSSGKPLFRALDMCA